MPLACMWLPSLPFCEIIRLLRGSIPFRCTSQETLGAWNKGETYSSIFPACTSGFSVNGLSSKKELTDTRTFFFSAFSFPAPGFRHFNKAVK